MRPGVGHLPRRLASDLALEVAGRKHLFSVLHDRRAFSLQPNPNLMRATLTWAKLLPFSPRSIVDVGAYQGDVSAELSILYRPEQMVLVEPFPDLARALEGRQFAPQQHVFNCALGRADGTGQFNVAASRHSSSLFTISKEAEALARMPVDRRETVEVPVRTLDGIVGEVGVDLLDLLKVDVQGYELEVFAGGTGTLGQTRLVLCEVSFVELYHGQPLFDTVYSVMRDAGFELGSLSGQWYDADGVPVQADALFINRVLARRVRAVA